MQCGLEPTPQDAPPAVQPPPPPPAVPRHPEAIDLAGQGGQAGEEEEENSTRFRFQFRKTSMCRYYERGECWNGVHCRFAHNREEVRLAPDLRKTSICKRWTAGECPYSAFVCNFAHGAAELRSTPIYVKTSLCRPFMRGMCRLGNRCRHAHGELEMQTAHAALEELQQGSNLAWEPDEGQAARASSDAASSSTAHWQGVQGVHGSGMSMPSQQLAGHSRSPLAISDMPGHFPSQAASPSQEETFGPDVDEEPGGDYQQHHPSDQLHHGRGRPTSHSKGQWKKGSTHSNTSGTRAVKHTGAKAHGKKGQTTTDHGGKAVKGSKANVWQSGAKASKGKVSSAAPEIEQTSADRHQATPAGTEASQMPASSSAQPLPLMWGMLPLLPCPQQQTPSHQDSLQQVAVVGPSSPAVAPQSDVLRTLMQAMPEYYED
mmetsp:Transcript_66971/g.160429  ORF Transcript_66971/g.160429 Transcript_66971/m.160429 type:complete len:431 (-) Transcript_66971:142-1434(-)